MDDVVEDNELVVEELIASDEVVDDDDADEDDVDVSDVEEDVDSVVVVDSVVEVLVVVVEVLLVREPVDVKSKLILFELVAPILLDTNTSSMKTTAVPSPVHDNWNLI